MICVLQEPRARGCSQAQATLILLCSPNGVKPTSGTLLQVTTATLIS
jgi:hypothetical protein